MQTNGNTSPGATPTEQFAQAYATAFERAFTRLLIRDYIKQAGAEVSSLAGIVHQMISAQLDHRFLHAFPTEADYQLALDNGIRIVRRNFGLD
ncbi:MAG TPA: hypothetical protein VHK91_12315 [Flavisolibacter sp.]|nr:hypothetical protein [Flavisolibacter sp.]